MRESPPMPETQRTLHARIWLYSILPAAGIWVILEILAWTVAWLASDAWREGWRSFYQPHPYRSYANAPNRISGPGHMSTNSLGLRGREIARVKPPGTVRIACIGASTTYSDGATTDSHAYPALVESALRYHYAGEPFGIEVLNCGVNAYESMQVLMYYETTILDYDPDIVLVLTGINDAVLQAQSIRFQSDYAGVRRTFGPPPPLWWEHSPLLSLVFKRRATAGNPYWPNETHGMMPFIWKWDAIDNPGRAAVEARLQAGRFEPYARNLRSLVHVIRGGGAVPILLTLPFRPDHASVAPFVAGVNERIRGLAADENVALLDLAELMPWNRDAFYDDCHLIDGPTGLWRKARIVVDFLVERDLVTDAAHRNDPSAGRGRDSDNE